MTWIDSVVSLFFRWGAFGRYRKGLGYLAIDDYGGALAAWRPLAVQGDAQAQFDVGLMYYSGLGVQQDFAQGISWFKKAADQEHAAAETFLGTIYRTGRGAPQDIEKALHYFRRAMEHGLPEARRAYAELLSHGLPDPKRYLP